MYSKPLYEAEKQIQYHKHLQRLQKISRRKKTNSDSRNVLNEMHRIRHQASQFFISEKREQISFENNKILNSIIEISERKSVPAYSFIASHCAPKKRHSIVTFQNPHRKKREEEIMSDNDRLAKRLLTKESEFDRQKTIKTIEKYEEVKRLMRNNRRIKLIPVYKGQGSYNFTRVPTCSNSQVISVQPSNCATIHIDNSTEDII